jgi:hypothetical protein
LGRFSYVSRGSLSTSASDFSSSPLMRATTMSTTPIKPAAIAAVAPPMKYATQATIRVAPQPYKSDLDIPSVYTLFANETGDRAGERDDDARKNTKATERSLVAALARDDQKRKRARQSQRRRRGPSSLRSLGMTRKGKGEATSNATERSLVAALARDDQKRKGRGKVKGDGEVPRRPPRRTRSG